MTPNKPLALAATAVVSLLTASSGPAFAHPVLGPLPAWSVDPRLRVAEHTAGDILVQPIRDTGLMNVEIPEPLIRATAAPYALSDGVSCAEISAEIAGLSAVLGPDLTADPAQHESRVGKLAEAGGRAAVNSLIPLRTLVREVTGAAPAQRRLQQAVELGYARRGFLRGIYRLRDCPADLAAGTGPVGWALSVTPSP